MEEFKDGLLNVQQVRERLNCSRSQVYNLIGMGKLPALKIGGRCGVRVRAIRLEEFLEQREMEEGLV